MPSKSGNQENESLDPDVPAIHTGERLAGEGCFRRAAESYDRMKWLTQAGSLGNGPLIRKNHFTG